MSFLGGMSASRLFLDPEVRTYTGWSLLLMADPEVRSGLWCAAR